MPAGVPRNRHMTSAAIESDHAMALPARHLAPLVRRYVGYRYRGLQPGFHRGLPSAELTVVLSLGAPTRVAGMPDPCTPATEFGALVGGLHTTPAVISYDDELYGVQLDVTPRGARSLFGVPAAELARTVVGLEELIGSDAGELVERMHAAGGWAARFQILDEALSRQVYRLAPAADAVERAWDLIEASGGAARVATVAAAVGWSRRQLHERFVREYGVTAKDLARVVRFDRSQRLLRRRPAMTLSEAAATSGYYDQAHMARDWNQLAGCPPSRWLADEELPFVQDEDLAAASSSAV